MALIYLWPYGAPGRAAGARVARRVLESIRGAALAARHRRGRAARLGRRDAARHFLRAAARCRGHAMPVFYYTFSSILGANTAWGQHYLGTAWGQHYLGADTTWGQYYSRPAPLEGQAPLRRKKHTTSRPALPEVNGSIRANTA